MKTRSLSFPTLLVLCLTACAALYGCGGGGDGGGNSGGSASGSGSSGGTQAGIAAPYRGIWLAQAYGRALEIEETGLRVLDYSSDFCLLNTEAEGLSTADIEGVWRLEAGQLEDYGSNGTAQFSAPGERYSASSSLPPSCAQAVTASVNQPGYQRDPERELALYAQILEEYSIHPQLRAVDISERYQELAPQISSDSSDAELIEALYQLALPLADIHTTVIAPEGVIQIPNKPLVEHRIFEEFLAREGISPPLDEAQIDAANAYINNALEQDRAITFSYAEDGTAVQHGAQGRLSWYTREELGYLAIDAMTGFSQDEDNAAQLAALESALDQALTDLRDAQGLIVDVRHNGGGQDFLSLAIASRFAGNSTLAYRKQARLGAGKGELREVFIEPRGAIQFLKPVVLLTSSSTVSGAEVFSLAMRSLPQVTLIGEATQGALSDKLTKTLANGFEIGLANEYYFSPEGELFEISGVPVDYEVSLFLPEHRDQGIDAGLETAAAFLRGE